MLISVYRPRVELMNALEALHNRVSQARLTAPGPDSTQRKAMFAAALRAADHGRLRPWRFLLIENEGLKTLGDLFVEAARADDPQISESALARFQAMPLRAPLIVAVIASCQEHPKVPEIEQQYSAAAAAQNMITAAFALGLGAVWRTGDMAYHPHVRKGLGLGEREHLVGFLYIGTPETPAGKPPSVNSEDFFASWPSL